MHNSVKGQLMVLASHFSSMYEKALTKATPTATPPICKFSYLQISMVQGGWETGPSMDTRRRCTLQ